MEEFKDTPTGLGAEKIEGAEDVLILMKAIHEGNFDALHKLGPAEIAGTLLSFFMLSHVGIEVFSGTRSGNETPLVRHFRDHVLHAHEVQEVDDENPSFKSLLAFLLECKFTPQEISTALNTHEFGLNIEGKEQFNQAARELDIAPIFSDEALRGFDKDGYIDSMQNGLRED